MYTHYVSTHASSMFYMGCGVRGCWRGVVAQLAAKARCPVLDSRRRHFLCSPKSFQRSTDSNDADPDLFRQVAFKVFGRSSFHRALLCLPHSHAISVGLCFTRKANLEKFGSFLGNS